MQINTKKLTKIAIITGISLGVIFILLVLANAFFKNNYLEFRSPLQSPILIKKREVVIKEVIKEEVKKEFKEGITESKEGASIEPEIKIAKVSSYSCGGIKTEAERAMNCPNGITATGTTPTPYKTVACDRADLGKEFEIEGIGRVKCEDVGGGIQGAGRFDLYLPTIQEAREFGVQYLAYKLVDF